MEKLARTLKNLQIVNQNQDKKIRELTSGEGDATWGSITGTLTNQTDLNTALNGKAATSHTQAFTTITGVATAAQIPTLDAAKVGTGTLALARIPTGTTASTVALGAHTHDISAFTSVPGYNASATQILKHVSGVLTWVTG